MKTQDRTAAIRIFFVIDRRVVVVDEAAEHATKIRKRPGAIRKSEF